MDTNINSFSENISKLTENASKIIEYAEGMNESLSGKNAYITLSDGTTIPSFSNIVTRVERAENTVAKFTQGKGTIQTSDGTYRKISVSTIPSSPERITGLSDVSTFTVDANWFFEDLQYPKCSVSIELKGKIEDSADRVYIDRIILDSNGTYADGTLKIIDYYTNSIKGTSNSYKDFIDALELNGIPYKEDIEEISLPLTYEKQIGIFKVNKVSLIKDSNGISRTWYYLDTIEYKTVDKNGETLSGGHTLKVGDFLRYGNSVYKITAINQNTNAVKIEYSIGYETVTEDVILRLYNDPFAEKTINIPVGINEIDIIYIKGVNENYNLLSNEWSEPVSFYTNDLKKSDDINTTLGIYHSENVSDFGKYWISQAKSGIINAYGGKIPNAPYLTQSDYRVVQINTQLDSVIDSERYNSLNSEISSVKSSIESIRNSITSKKDILVNMASTSERSTMMQSINSDSETLSSLNSRYYSLVTELKTLLSSSGTVVYTPKYHVRGFFAIPNSRYAYESETINTGEEKIIAFETKYRYIRTDETGTTLNTFTYTDSENNEMSGTFSDWNIVTGKILEKIYDDESDTFVWQTTSEQNGSEININQIDIPIRNGEKVEFMVRSISEAGYPSCPLKSEWSNSVIIDFPSNLSDNDSATNALQSVNSDMYSISLEKAMTSTGIYTHINDSNSTYMHHSKNISYSVVNTEDNTENEISLQSKVDQLSSSLETVSSFGSVIENLNSNMQTVNSTLNSMNTRIDELEFIISGDTNDTSNYRSIITTHSSSITQLNSTLNSLRSKISIFQENLRQLSIDTSDPNHEVYLNIYNALINNLS